MELEDLIIMNYWTELSIEFANQRNYLDELFKVYPTIPEGIREIDDDIWRMVERHFHEGNKFDLLRALLELPLFPIKDSYVAYLRRDPSAIERNPRTIDRFYGRFREMGLDEIYDKCTEPKETNRQMGPLFKRWLEKGTLGFPCLNYNDFVSTGEDAILIGSDNELMGFARERLNYNRQKGLDFVARINNEYIIGEAKFLTDFGGHQNAQVVDAMNTLRAQDVDARIIAILDGVLYIESNNKMHRIITGSDYDILSALVLREFLYQI